MASFNNKVATAAAAATTTTSTPSAPRPIATAVPPSLLPSAFTRDRFFSHGNDEDEENEEEGGLHEESEGEEEDEEVEDEEEEIGDGENGVDLEKIDTGDNWNSQFQVHENPLLLPETSPCLAHTFNLVNGPSSSSGQNDPVRGQSNGCGFSGREEEEEGSYWHVLRSHFSDPVTGALMDDAMILTCGHSYGKGGMQQVYRMKSCYKCSQPISEDSVQPNLALRSAVEAFRREEEMHLWKISKKKRDHEQEKGGYDDALSNDFLRNRASLFPLAISDRVMIKGNKRTPPRFVGRVAVVTAQCLNGWYVVKTLDNGESVKLQFGSLAKVSSFH